MSHSIASVDRRGFLRGSLALGAGAWAFASVRGAFAEELARTPRLTEGPFYPDQLPLDTDNDLLIINDSITPAVGEITHLTGKILDAKGSPIRNAAIEIWQVDNRGVYINTRDSASRKRDTNFQGFGRDRAIFGKRRRQPPQNRQAPKRIVEPRSILPYLLLHVL